LGSFSKITELALFFSTFSQSTSFFVILWRKVGWATFWATLSQTYPVTLAINLSENM
jgi:hypothetical protein